MFRVLFFFAAAVFCFLSIGPVALRQVILSFGLSAWIVLWTIRIGRRKNFEVFSALLVQILAGIMAAACFARPMLLPTYTSTLELWWAVSVAYLSLILLLQRAFHRQRLLNGISPLHQLGLILIGGMISYPENVRYTNEAIVIGELVSIVASVVYSVRLVWRRYTRAAHIP